MSEFITIQVGQCGNQIGNCMWPQILQEYGIDLNPAATSRTGLNYGATVQKSLNSFFYVPSRRKAPNVYEKLSELAANKVKARAICIDMEDGVLTRLRNSHLKSLFDKRCFVTNYPGSGNNWAEGFLDHGPKHKDRILDSIRHAVERCDCLHGFLLLFSVGGGTGSGLGTYILKLLDDHYNNIERFVTCVYPTGTEDVITCPYNMAFATQQLLSHATCVFPIENRALLYMLSQRNNKYQDPVNNLSLFKPFEDLNNIIVNMLLHLTSGSRFSGSLNLDMNEINTNMVPYPKLNYISSGVNPFTLNVSNKMGKETSQQLKDEHFWLACNKNSHLLKFNPLGPKSILLGATILARGDYTMTDMRSYVDKLQDKANFTAWSAKSIKVGLCKIPPVGINASILSLFNTSAMSSLFETVLNQYVKLYQKKAHAHHYTKIAGFEQDHFVDCHTTLADMIDSYKEMETAAPQKIARLVPSTF